MRERERERERERWSLKENLKGMCWEISIEKDTWVFQIIRKNKMSINTNINNLGCVQILAEMCGDFYPDNDASHYISPELRAV